MSSATSKAPAALQECGRAWCRAASRSLVMNVRIASEAGICWSFAQPSEWRLWISIWISSWDPLRLCDAIRRTTSAPPGQNPGRAKPRSAHSPLQKSQQQRSDQPSKPVKSEQDNCSFDSNHSLHTVRIAFPLGRSLAFFTSPQWGRALSFVGRSG